MLDHADIPLENATVLMMNKTTEKESLIDMLSGFLAQQKQQIFSCLLPLISSGFWLKFLLSRAGTMDINVLQNRVT